MPTKDTHALAGEPKDAPTAGTGKKQVQAGRESFNASVGHGNAGGGQKTPTGPTLDQPLTYSQNVTWAKSMGKAGSFGTPFHQGKTPIKYDASADPTDY